VDFADKIDSIHFGPGKPADKTQGKADTLLEEHVLECDHGPEDFRDGSSQNAAGVTLQRKSRKSQGMSYKVRSCCTNIRHCACTPWHGSERIGPTCQYCCDVTRVLQPLNVALQVSECLMTPCAPPGRWAARCTSA